ncbi:MAG: family 1 glycosylhydrolase, partial [Pseudomonadota bacterium]
CRVGLSHSAPFVQACRPKFLPDVLCARVRDHVLNDLTFRFLGKDPAAHLDYLGINYYTRTVVRWRPFGMGAVFGKDCVANHHGQDRVYSDLGWEVFPAGLTEVLRHFQYLGVPLMITENGVATTDETLRRSYLSEHLAALGKAMDEGINIIGYLYWTLMDNFEWSAGWGPKFGLAETTRDTLDRIPRDTASLLAEVCQNWELPIATGTYSNDLS